MLTVLDLFSGLGGFSLGLERTGGFRTVAFCEIDPYCRRVLAKHWPEVPCHEDVRTLDAARLERDGIGRPDVICGGFPCQDVSLAGAGAGLEGERSGLWSEYARLVRELRPRYVIVENVAALLGRGIDRVLGELAALGYDAEWHCIPASAIGATHHRDRIWIIAYPGGTGMEGPLISRDLVQAGQGRWGGETDCPDWPAIGSSRPADDRWIESALRRTDDGLSGVVDRLRAIGNSVVPQIPQLIGEAILAAEAHNGDAVQIRAWRQRHGWTQEQAAEVLGVTKDAFRYWEYGRRSVPGPVKVLIRYIDRHGLLDKYG